MTQAVVGALRVTLGMDSAAFSKGLRNAEARLSRFGKMASKGLLAVGAAATTAAAGLAVSVRGTLTAADAMAKASRKIGVPVAVLSRLKHAADLSGVSFDGLQTALRRLSVSMEDARAGTGEAHAAFDRLGVSVTQADGTLKSSSQVLRELAAAFAGLPDGAEKTALAMDLMGRSGTDMIPMLNGGTAALDNMMAEADGLGLVFTEDMTAHAEAFNDNMTRLGAIFGVLGRQLAADLAPHLEAFSDWLVTHAPRIAEMSSAMIAFGVAVVREISSIVTALADAWGAFETWWGGLVDWGGRVKTTVRETADAILTTFSELPGEMVDLGRQIMLGLVDGILSEVTHLKDQILEVGDNIGAWFRDTLDIRSPSKVMMTIGEEVMRGLARGLAGLQDSVVGLAGTISNSVAGAFSGIVTGARSVEEALKSVLEQVSNAALTRAVNGFVSSAFAVFGGGIAKPMFGGFFADGGSLGAGEWGIVGENGPEIIHGPAHITPLEAGGRIRSEADDPVPVVIHMSVQTPDVDSFRRSEGQIGGVILDTVARGRRGR
ncbi:hypothetical protein [Roseibium sp.]|uniref:hypothetical protein n=1 Tax=Roseibium sp. TaxID=1936156 RepID=UPI003B50D930